MGKGLLLAAAIPVVLLAGAKVALNSSLALRAQVGVKLFGWEGIQEIARAGLAQRLLGPRPTKSREAWFALLNTLADADEKYLTPMGRAITQPDDIAEGHRFFTHLLRTGFEFFVEGDGDLPALRPFVSADRKFIGDNTDALYYTSPLDQRRAYLLRGRRSPGEVYIAMTVYNSTCEGCFIKETVSEINDRTIGVGPVGSDAAAYSVLLAAHRPDGYEGHFMPLAPASADPRALMLMTRHYFENPVSVTADPAAVPPTVSIALADPATGNPLPFDYTDKYWLLPGGKPDGMAAISKVHYTQVPSKPWGATQTDGEMARKLRAVERFVAQYTTEMVSNPADAPEWFSFERNKFGMPARFRDQPGTAAGAGGADLAYAAAPYDIMDDEALVIDGVMPKAAFGNVKLWNKYLQTYEFVGRRTSLHRKQMSLGGKKPGEAIEGKFRLILAHKNPGPKYDWLDTVGRRTGTVMWRFVLPEGPLHAINASVVKFASL